jgi:hypothetical protein
MKKIFYLTAVFCLGISLSLQAQEPTAPAQAPVPTGNEPEIKFEKIEHDYGNILKGDDVLANSDLQCRKSDLILTNVRSSCGCTVPSWPKEPLAPGQSSVIQVKYNTQRIGLISKRLP